MTLAAVAQSQTPVQLDDVFVGETHEVGEFFWIDKGSWIGFAGNATHGNCLSEGGSVDTSCTVRILAIKNDYAAVVVSRPKTPYGAQCAHGAIFQMPVVDILAWRQKNTDRRQTEKMRTSLMASIGTVMA